MTIRKDNYQAIVAGVLAAVDAAKSGEWHYRHDYTENGAIHRMNHIASFFPRVPDHIHRERENKRLQEMADLMKTIRPERTITDYYDGLTSRFGAQLND